MTGLHWGWTGVGEAGGVFAVFLSLETYSPDAVSPY